MHFQVYEIRLIALVLCLLGIFHASAQRKVLFDLSHGQFQDVFVDPSYYDYVIPGYEEIAHDSGYQLILNRGELTADVLKGMDAVLIISPLAKATQKNSTETEKQALVRYVKKGGSLILFVDEEVHRVDLDAFGANDITEPFGITQLSDVDVPGNCGGITFENEIFHGLREIPVSGVRAVRGGIPASVCMEQGVQISSYAKQKNGGRIYVAGETMVALLMGFPDGDRNVHKRMETRWWGKDSRLYMKELLLWVLNK